MPHYAILQHTIGQQSSMLSEEKPEKILGCQCVRSSKIRIYSTLAASNAFSAAGKRLEDSH